MTYTKGKWDLTKLLKKGTKEEVLEKVEEIKQKVEQIEKYKDKLDSITPTEFTQIIKVLEQIKHDKEIVYMYLSLRFHANTKDQEAGALLSQLESELSRLGNKILFFALWFKELSDDSAQKFIDSMPGYEYYLKDIRRSKPYILSEKEEKIINLLSTHGVGALESVYSIFTNSFMFEWEGKKITQEELISKVRSSKPEVRKKAYQTLLGKYTDNKLVINEIYKHIVLDWKTEGVDLRGYKSPLFIRSFSQNLREETVKLLMDVCRENVKLFQKYFLLKAKLIGVEKLKRFDIYAPLKEIDEHFEYGDAVQKVIDTYSEFDTEMGELAKSMFDENLVDSDVCEGKRSGAFCMSGPIDYKPYVLLSFVDKWKDISTLAHEIGHAIHHMLAAKTNNNFTVHAELPVCETASIFGEQLLAEKVLSEVEDDVKIDILAQQIDGMYGSIMRQIYFVIFEELAHKAYAEGATVDEMSEIYYGTLKEHFGDSVELTDDFKWEWLYIPHIFHTPFYCYAYSFGNLLVLALYKKYKEEGDSFVPKIKKMLELGGSMSPEEVVATAGFDINQKEFWQGGFDVIKEMIAELEKLVK
ncbi:M3 family oligoendopeptidase [Candidatus Woesearchaeota archaeon]|jgi:oligoendopeptidase F|nr:M3 family oligoendopeptidase [Candidatus Woesearchaeota archaeon]